MAHTNEFLQGMFAAYRGCSVKSKISGSTYKTIGISYKESCFIVCNGDRVSKGDLHLYPKDLMPILTPISEITDEDAVEVGRIIGVIDEDCPNEDLSYWAGYTRKVYLNKHKYGSDRVYHVIDYLRSKHYDCGYLHISSLIEAGLAVKATK
jgi:hypothetical protein